MRSTTSASATPRARAWPSPSSRRSSGTPRPRSRATPRRRTTSAAATTRARAWPSPSSRRSSGTPRPRSRATPRRSTTSASATTTARAWPSPSSRRSSGGPRPRSRATPRRSTTSAAATTTARAWPSPSSTAVEWWTKAAEQGHAAAQNNLGSCYYEGEGVAQSFEQAVEWWTKAAEQGHAEAQNNLGGRYYSGEGVAQSFEHGGRVVHQGGGAGPRQGAAQPRPRYYTWRGRGSVLRAGVRVVDQGGGAGRCRGAGHAAGPPWNYQPRQHLPLLLLCCMVALSFGYLPAVPESGGLGSGFGVASHFSCRCVGGRLGASGAGGSGGLLLQQLGDFSCGRPHHCLSLLWAKCPASSAPLPQLYGRALRWRHPATSWLCQGGAAPASCGGRCQPRHAGHRPAGLHRVLGRRAADALPAVLLLGAVRGLRDQAHHDRRPRPQPLPPLPVWREAVPPRVCGVTGWRLYDARVLWQWFRRTGLVCAPVQLSGATPKVPVL